MKGEQTNGQDLLYTRRGWNATNTFRKSGRNFQTTFGKKYQLPTQGLIGGTAETGHNEVLGFDVYEKENKEKVLPGKMRTYFRTTNHIERINRELKRRSKVIGIFPNPASIIRLMGSVLIDLNEKMQEKNAIYSKETYNTVVRSDAPLKLLKIAEIQRELFIAWGLSTLLKVCKGNLLRGAFAPLTYFSEGAGRA